MKSSRILIVASIIALALSGWFFYQFSPYLNFINLTLAILGVVLGIIWDRENKKDQTEFRDENRLQHLQLLESLQEKTRLEMLAKNEQDRSKELEVANSKLQQLMRRVSVQLKDENISKEHILQHLDKPLYVLLLNKSHEASLDRSDVKPLRDKILPSLGFRYIKGSRGMYVLPPSQLPSFRNRNELDSWIEQNIKGAMPAKFRYILAFISLVDLRYTVTIKADTLSKKYETLLDTIKAEELLTFNEGLTYLQKKKHLSLKDIIHIPNFFFLSEGTSLPMESREKLLHSNEQIIKRITTILQRETKTEDVASISDNNLSEILSSIIKINEADIQKIKDNAHFWSDFLK
jgi:hypothetical protein